LYCSHVNLRCLSSSVYAAFITLLRPSCSLSLCRLPISNGGAAKTKPSKKSLSALDSEVNIVILTQLYLPTCKATAFGLLHSSGSAARNVRPTHRNVTIKASSDLAQRLPRTSECCLPKTKCVCSVWDFHLINQSNCSLRIYLATFAHFQFRTRIVERFNLFDFVSILSCTENRGRERIQEWILATFF